MQPAAVGNLPARRRRTGLFAGRAQVPQGTALHGAYQHVSVILEIDLDQRLIVNADFTVLSEVTRQWLRETVTGHHLSRGIEELVQHLELYCQVPVKKAFVRALRAAYSTYQEWLEGNPAS